ncbi:MAG: SpoIIE family protein phosphatase [Rhodospirillales bacterium]|nr:SpoIIE family protein phosphatase [Rhodospirillales bacterium]MDE2199327.1 SpoIIE family protein phosphatase [Rhodospirillales bacterium]
MIGGDDDIERTMTLRAPVSHAPPVAVGHFIAYGEGEALRRVAIDAAGLTIGRQAPSELVIPAPDISRRHCRIELDGEWAVLSDLGSTNGTFVSGERVVAPMRLRNGSRLSLGTFELRYERRDRREVAEEAELAAELRRAADYVRAILPAPIATGPVQTEWWFVPSSQLGGDAFGYQFLDDDHFAGFVLDVSGHGIGSAMHAANVANVLRRRALPAVDFRDPAQVAAGLNAMFPMEEHNGLMLTLWYFVYQPSTRALLYCAAGHHPSFLVAPGAAAPEPLWLRGPAIGLLARGNWGVGRAEIPPDSRLFVFSDGAFEIIAASGEPWVIEDLRQIVMQPAMPGLSEPQRLYRAVRAAARPGPLDDDFSVLAVSFG